MPDTPDPTPTHRAWLSDPDVYDHLRALAPRFTRYARADRDELVQEAALAMLRGGAAFDPGKNPAGAGGRGTFLAQRLLWTGWKLKRKAARRAARERPLRTRDDDGSPWDVSDPNTVGRQDHEPEVVDRLRHALTLLPAADRELVARRFGLDGRDAEVPKDIAPAAGVRSEAVTVRVRRALMLLAAALGETDGCVPAGFVSVESAAEILGLTVSAVTRLVVAGRLTACRRAGGAVGVGRESVLRLLHG